MFSRTSLHAIVFALIATTAIGWMAGAALPPEAPAQPQAVAQAKPVVQLEPVNIVVTRGVRS